MFSNLKIPRELRRMIDNELQPGELLRWIEQPLPRFFTAGSIKCVLLGIPWTSFAISLTWGVASELNLPDPRETLPPEYLSVLFSNLILIPFVLLGMGFVLLGFGMLLSPIWLWQEARNTVYLVTDKRALLVFRFFSSTLIRSYFPDQFKDIHRKERADGTGLVIFSSRRLKEDDVTTRLIFRNEEIDLTGGVISSTGRWKDGEVTTRGIIKKEELNRWGVRNPREVENLLKQLARNNV
jgi:hypothetical protein